MATTNRRTTTDYVKLEITWDVSTRIDLEYNRNSERVSYRQALDPELAAKILEAAKVPAEGTDTIGQWVEKVWECAARTKDPIELLTLLRALPRPGESRRARFLPRAP